MNETFLSELKRLTSTIQGMEAHVKGKNHLKTPKKSKNKSSTPVRCRKCGQSYHAGSCGNNVQINLSEVIKLYKEQNPGNDITYDLSEDEEEAFDMCDDA